METLSALLAICAGNSPVPGEFPAQRPVTRSFDVFFDLRLNKRLSKQLWGWWFETLSCPLWRHCNGSTTKSGGRITTGRSYRRARINSLWGRNIASILVIATPAATNIVPVVMVMIDSDGNRNSCSRRFRSIYNRRKLELEPANNFLRFHRWSLGMDK